MENNSKEDQILDEMFNSFRVDPIALDAADALAMAKGKIGSNAATKKSSWYHFLWVLIVLPSLFFIPWKQGITPLETPLIVNKNKTNKGVNSLSIASTFTKEGVFNMPQVNLQSMLSIAPLVQPETKPAPNPSLLKPIPFTMSGAEPSQVGALVLSENELKNLHIYTNNCELYYTNLKDSMYIQRNLLPKAPIKCIFYLYIDKTGGGYTNTCHNRFTEKELDSLSEFLLPAYPMVVEQRIDAVENKNGSSYQVGDKRQFLLDYQISVTNEDFYLDCFKTQLVPVEVQLIGKANIYGKKDQTVTFWYKPNEAFLSTLSPQNRVMIKQQYAHFSEKAYTQKQMHFNDSMEKVTQSFKVDALLFDSLLKHAISFDKKQLNALGIKVNKSEIYYKHRSSKNVLTLKVGANKTFLNNTTKFNKVANTSVARAMFYSGNHISSLMLLDQTLLPKQYTTTKWNEKERLFIAHYKNLVPVRVSYKGKRGEMDVGYFWFEKEAILKP